jgi:hypothetical protein
LKGNEDHGAMARWRLRGPAGRSDRPRARIVWPKIPRARAAKDQRDTSIPIVPSQRPEAGELPEGLDGPGGVRPLSHNDAGQDAATAGRITRITLTRDTFVILIKDMF